MIKCICKYKTFFAKRRPPFIKTTGGEAYSRTVAIRFRCVMYPSFSIVAIRKEKTNKTDKHDDNSTNKIITNHALSCILTFVGWSFEKMWEFQGKSSFVKQGGGIAAGKVEEGGGGIVSLVEPLLVHLKPAVVS